MQVSYVIDLDLDMDASFECSNRLMKLVPFHLRSCFGFY